MCFDVATTGLYELQLQAARFRASVGRVFRLAVNQNIKGTADHNNLPHQNPV